jgi:PD-(D/E)XK nuclease superfamily
LLGRADLSRRACRAFITKLGEKIISREGREGAKFREGAVMDVEELSAIAVDCGLTVHKELGPGMLESAYEAVLVHLLIKRGLSVERLSPLHARQVTTYLKFTGLRIGLLMNFSCERFTDGLKRLVNDHKSTSNSLLSINQKSSRTFAPSRPSREIPSPPHPGAAK